MLKTVLSSMFSSPKAAAEKVSERAEVTVVTTMHAKGYLSYGRAFIESFVNHWPNNYSLSIYAEDFEIEAASPRVKVVDLHSAIPALYAFKKKHAATPLAGGMLGSGYNYRFDAIRFANKSYVMCEAARRATSQHLLWLDADIRTFQDVPADFVSRVLSDQHFMAYLGRVGSHTETGFLPFDLSHPQAKAFFETLEQMYATDTVFTLREWHDCEVIDNCRAVMTAQGLMTARNINAYGATHPFVNSVAGLFMDHMKGPARKDSKQSNPADYLIPPAGRVNFYAGRYGQITPLMKQLLPTEIVEVGTWSGWRGVQMALPSLAAGKPVHYKGYDVFDDFTPEFDAKEMNVKPHFSLKEVERLLNLLGDLYPRFSFELIKGNSNETLTEERSEFVFIDGGHSVETIRSDFAAVAGSQVILLDDYYSAGIDIGRFGCNQIVDGLPHEVLPVKDPVNGGGTTQFAMVVNTR